MTKRGLRLAGVVFALVLALTSCVSPEELRREDEATCAGYGFHPNTDAFATCLQRESLARRALTAYPGCCSAASGVSEVCADTGHS